MKSERIGIPTFFYYNIIRMKARVAASCTFLLSRSRFGEMQEWSPFIWDKNVNLSQCLVEGGFS